MVRGKAWEHAFLFKTTCIYNYVCGGKGRVHVSSAYVERSENNLWRSVLSLHYEDLRSGIQVVRLVSKCPPQLSHLTGPESVLLIVTKVVLMYAEV